MIIYDLFQIDEPMNMGENPYRSTHDPPIFSFQRYEAPNRWAGPTNFGSSQPATARHSVAARLPCHGVACCLVVGKGGKTSDLLLGPNSQSIITFITRYQGLVNVPIKHHPTIGDINSNRYLKVMLKKSPKRDIYQPLDIEVVLRKGPVVSCHDRNNRNISD